VGVVFAALNAIGQLLFMPAYPFWSLSILVLDLIVIWALTMHGREVAGSGLGAHHGGGCSWQI
jgi:hypothetical protein